MNFVYDLSKSRFLKSIFFSSKKRRLLQLQLVDQSQPPKNIGHTKIAETNQAIGMMEERRLPRLDPIPPLKGCIFIKAKLHFSFLILIIQY